MTMQQYSLGFFLFAVFFIVLHVRWPIRRLRARREWFFFDEAFVYLALGLMVMTLMTIGMVSVFSIMPKLDVELACSILFLYGVMLYIGISRLMVVRVAYWLTLWRGAKWIKELDYLYLAAGSIGVFLSVAKLPNAAPSFQVPSLWGPMLVVVAIVLRLVKTRAEINEWNKLAGERN